MGVIKLWSLASTIAALCAVTPQKSEAQTVGQGGISLPATIDQMTVVEGTPKEFTQAFVLQNGSDRISINVFQANFPNVGIWHEAHKSESLGLFEPLAVTQIGKANQIAVNSGKPNGLVEVFSVGAPFASTAIITIGFGRWIVTVHSTSKSLTTEEQAARVSRIIQAIKPKHPVTETYSIRVPDTCGAKDVAAVEKEGTGPLQEQLPEAGLVGDIQLAISKSDAVGKTAGGGLSMNPDQFCKATSVSGRTVWYQTKHDLGLLKWVQLVSVTGLAVEGFAIPGEVGKNDPVLLGGIIAHGYRSSKIVNFHKGLPNPVSGQLEGLLVLAQEVGAK
jgi:hypothetical protein